MAGYTNLVGQFIYKQPLLRAKLDGLGENDQFLKDNGWQDGTVAIFFQSSAPTGWTQNVTQNNRGLRVTNGVGGLAGGSHLISSAIPLNHTAHSISTQADHTHTITGHTHKLTTAASNGLTPGGTTQNLYADGSDFIRYFSNTGSGLSKSILRNILDQVSSSITTGAAGSHAHGGATTGSALSDISLAYVDVIIASKNSSSGYTDYSNFFNHNDQIKYQPFAAVGGLYGNDSYLSARLTPAGTVSFFAQASAPTGWTKSTVNNDKLLRVVSGSGGGSGGSHGLGQSIPLAHNHTMASFTLPAHTIPNHTHRLNNSFNGAGADAPAEQQYFYKGASNLIRSVSASGPAATNTVLKRVTTSSGSGSTNADSSAHAHNVGSSLTNIILNYIDVIQCSKNSGGAPYPFVDLTSTVQFKKLVSKQRLDAFAKNDEYLRYHTIESGTLAFFYQANAPLTWTKLLTQNDRGLRVVSGAGGGTGGSQGFGSTIVLAHTHSISTYGHSHAIGSHTHPLEEASQSTYAPTGTNGVSDLGNPTSTPIRLMSNAGAQATLTTNSDASSGFTSVDNHNHGGATGSLLSNITLAYADVVYCLKN